VTGALRPGRLALVVWLTVVWCLLWEDASPGTVVAGLVVAVAVTVLVRFRDDGQHGTVRPLPALRFWLWFAWALVTSTWAVVREAVVPRGRSRLREGIVAVPVRGPTDFVVTLVSNTISLTPGTLTLEARQGDPTVLFVHAMHLDDPDDVRREVHRIEEMVVRAFGPAAAVAALADPPPELPAGLDPTTARDRGAS
jgi:multicomponent Na+:H+ antiporter subunit E